MTNETTSPVEVTQADANAWLASNAGRVLDCRQAFMAGAVLARHRIASRATDNALAEATKIIRHLVGDWDGYPDSEMLELVTRDDSIIPDDHDEPLGDPGVTVGQLRRILAALEGEG